MNIVEAIGLAQSGHRVRPKCWRDRAGSRHGCFVEASLSLGVVQVSRNWGDHITPTLCHLDRIEEIVGEWEVVETPVEA